MPSPAIADRPFVDATGQSQDSQDLRSFSEKIESLAVGLQDLAHFGDGESATIKKSVASRLIQLTNDIGSSMKKFGDIFEAVGPPGDVVSIESRAYSSAHHAAFGEACFILKGLEPSLYPVDWMEDTFDPSDIIENWNRDSNAIAKRLSITWRDDFKVVRARIRRERAALERAESRQVSQAAPPNLHGAANRRGASNESANGQPSQLQLPNLPVVNLELNQIRYAGQCFSNLRRSRSGAATRHTEPVN